MGLQPISTVEDLKNYLATALQLEHATIPPYMMALYSIEATTNHDATHILRVVLVEEMLHLTLAANILNALGGEPDLTVEGFVPRYPAYLPSGETDFEVNLERFSIEAVKTFLNIERPAMADEPSRRMIRRPRPMGGASLCHVKGQDDDLHFYSIGEFYEEIERGLFRLEKTALECGKTLFVGPIERQVGPEQYYSGGGEIHVVTDLESALQAIELIKGQGEGAGGGIYDKEKELAHYYRFQQLELGRYYQPGDEPNCPSGPTFEVEWDAVYPIKTNLRRSDLPEGSEVLAAAEHYDTAYAEFLAELTRAFAGEPERLMGAVGMMFRIKEAALQLIRNPIPGQCGVNAAPTYDIDGNYDGASHDRDSHDGDRKFGGIAL